jgi:transcription antitermination protein NusB
MLSRRSVRIKVMQLLYMLNRDESLDFKTLVKEYNDGIWRTYELYIFHLYYFTKIAQFAEQDAAIRAAKLLPGDEDRAFLPRLFTNPSLQSIANNIDFLNVVQKYECDQKLDNDHIRTLYNGFVDTDECKAYLALPETKPEDDNKIMLEMYKFLTNHDLFIDNTDDRYNNWYDDESLVVGAIKKTLKSSPVSGTFYKDYEPNDETVREFGEQLLMKVCQEDAMLFSHIEPVLKNWDAERVAVLDMVMIKMALSELMHFPTIPTKVTLNEFVEMSKSYSTDKSKDFINGVLDRLMKKLQKEGKILKEGRGLVE